MFTGIRLYAAVGLLAVLLGLGGMVWVQSLRLDAARERAARLETEKQALSDALTQSESDKARLRDAQRRLDALVRQLQAEKLEAAKAKKEADDAYAKLRAEAQAADQACLDRPVPPEFAVRLRD